MVLMNSNLESCRALMMMTSTHLDRCGEALIQHQSSATSHNSNPNHVESKT